MLPNTKIIRPARLLGGLGLVIACVYMLFAHGVNQHKPTLRIKYINQCSDFESSQFTLVRKVLEEKYNLASVKDGEDYDMIVDGVFGNQQIENQKSFKLFITGEAYDPPIEKYDLVIGFSTTPHPNYIRIPLYYMSGNFSGDKISTEFNRGQCKPKSKKYFACFLVANGDEGINERNKLPFDGCVARNKVFNKLLEYKFVASGGPHLNNIGNVIPRGDKYTVQWLSKCKFVIAYENQSYDGYITEKVFQAYLAGAIPLYYSDPSAVRDINKKSVIYAGDFSSEEAMVEYIKKVDQDDDLYCDIWNQRIITNPEQNYEAVKTKLAKKILPLIEAKLHK